MTGWIIIFLLRIIVDPGKMEAGRSSPECTQTVDSVGQ